MMISLWNENNHHPFKILPYFDITNLLMLKSSYRMGQCQRNTIANTYAKTNMSKRIVNFVIWIEDNIIMME